MKLFRRPAIKEDEIAPNDQGINLHEPIGKSVLQQIEYVFGVTKTGLDIVDSKYNIRYINPEWAKYFGPPDEKKCFEYFLGRKSPCPNCGVKKALETKSAIVSEEYLNCDGDRPIQVTTIPFRTEDGEWLVAEFNIDITARKALEESFHEIDNRFNAALKNSAIAVAHQDRELKYTWMYNSFPGLPIEPVLGKSDADLLPKSEADKINDIKEKVLSTGAGEHAEVEIIKDGKKFYYDMTIEPVMDAVDAVVGIITSSQDITAKKMVQDEFAKSVWNQKALNQLLKISLENLSLDEILQKALDIILSIEWLSVQHKGAIFMVEEKPDTLVLRAQTGLACQIQTLCKNVKFGRCLCGRAAQTGKVIFEAHLDSKHENTYKSITPHGHYCLPIKSEGKVIGVLTLYLEDGHTRDEIEIAFLESVAGTLAGIISRKQAEISLRESENRFRNIIDITSDWVWEADAKGKIVYISQQAADALGFSLEELIGKPLFSHIPQEKLSQAMDTLGKAMENQKAFLSYEINAQKKDSTPIILEVSGVPIYNSKRNFKGYRGVMRNITERRHVEKVLRESEQWFRGIYEKSPIGIELYDAEGKLTDANNACLDIFGISSVDKIIGFNLFDDPNVHSEFKEKIRRGQSLRYDLNFSFDKVIEYNLYPTTKSGHIYLDVQVTPLKGESISKPTGYLIQVHDITNRKKAEEALRDSKEFLLNIINSINDPIYVKDEEHRFVLLNDAFGSIVGRSHEELIGKTVYDLFPREQADIMSRSEEKVLMSGMEDINEEKANDAAGQTRTMITGKTLFTEKSGKKYLVGIISDITDRVEAENQLRVYSDVIESKNNELDKALKETTLAKEFLEQNAVQLKMLVEELNRARETLSRNVAMYTTMINTVPEMIYMKDVNHRFLLANEAFCKDLSLNSDDIVGRTEEEIFTFEKAAEFHQDDEIVMKENIQIVDQERQIKDSNNEDRWILATKVPLRDVGGATWGMVNVTRNVTDAQLSRQKLVQSDKLAAIGTLAAGVAHEINNPIGYVNSNLNTMSKYLKKISDYLEQNKSADESQMEKMKEILADFNDAINESIEGSSRVKKIVADLKSFSRIDRAERENADINEGIKSTLNIVWNELKYKCKVETEYGELPELYCMPNQLNQVFMNVTLNAGQSIAGDNGLIKIKTWADAKNIYISIRDNGNGIPEQNLKKIFEPFFTTKPVGKGTGLGLSLVYDIIKKHNGNIGVKSQVGIGTEFIITLPLEGIGESQ